MKRSIYIEILRYLKKEHERIRSLFDHAGDEQAEFYAGQLDLLHQLEKRVNDEINGIRKKA